ncbi:MAG: hypothetical protein KC592_14110, partial [Nitrospira sp.]|nr:hypothetical protein [Nitrospira sp.]
LFVWEHSQMYHLFFSSREVHHEVFMPVRGVRCLPCDGGIGSLRCGCQEAFRQGSREARQKTPVVLIRPFVLLDSP